MKLEKHIRRYTSIAAVIDMLRRKEFTLLDPTSWDDRNDSYFMELYKEARHVGGLYASCAATCTETYHHWRVFTGSADGACMELRREPLEAALHQIPAVRFGEVTYLTLDEVEELRTKDRDRLPFVKRSGFAAEEEYRIIAETEEAQRQSIGIELPLSWVRKIYLNPWLPQSIAESVRQTIREIPGCKTLSVSRSLLINSGLWKRAGDKVIGREPAPRLTLRRVRKLRSKKPNPSRE